jgi:hypothetical protein
MAFTIEDYHDLVQLLTEHPEWRPELRRLVLTDELLELPELVRELTRAQQKTEERLARLEGIVTNLAEQLQSLTQQVNLLTLQVQTIAGEQKRHTDTLGDFKGRLLEMTYRDHAPGYFGRWLRRARAVGLETLEERLETVLSHEELLEVLNLDLLINGRRRDIPATPEVWLAVEVASVVNDADVERAGRRAMLLRRAGYPALPVVAGENITLSAEASARTQKVVVVQDRRSFLWEEATKAWLQE